MSPSLSPKFLARPLATWHSTTAVVAEAGEIGVALIVDGNVIRYRLPVSSALHLAQSILDYVQPEAAVASHRDCEGETA